MNTTVTRIKLLLLIVASGSTALVRDIRIAAIFFAGILLLFWITRQQETLRKRMVPLVTIAALVLCFQILFHRTVPLDVRIFLGLTAGLKIMTLSLFVFLFSQITSPSSLVRALSFLPTKLQLVFTVSLSLIPILIHEAQLIQRAQQSRGYTARWKDPLGSVIPLIIPLLHRTLTRAEHIALVMQAKGYAVEVL